MSIIALFIDLVLHIDKHLASIIESFGPWSYVLLFMVLFLETGVVIAPYLPGDSLIFAIGAFTALGAFNLWLIWVVLVMAAILGDSLNYAVGKYLGPKVFKKNYSWLNMRALDKTKSYFDKHGGKTIILARFIPIIRTFAPFLAGVGTMNYRKFLAYNIIGGIAWVSIFLFAGFYFGNIPWIKDNFGLVVIGIIVVSVVPLIYELINYYFELQQQKKKPRK